VKLRQACLCLMLVLVCRWALLRPFERPRPPKVIPLSMRYAAEVRDKVQQPPTMPAVVLNCPYQDGDPLLVEYFAPKLPQVLSGANLRFRFMSLQL